MMYQKYSMKNFLLVVLIGSSVAVSISGSYERRGAEDVGVTPGGSITGDGGEASRGGDSHLTARGKYDQLPAGGEGRTDNLAGQNVTIEDLRGHIKNLESVNQALTTQLQNKELLNKELLNKELLNKELLSKELISSKSLEVPFQILEFYVANRALKPVTGKIENIKNKIIPKGKPKEIFDTLIRPEDVTAIGVHVLRKEILNRMLIKGKHRTKTTDALKAAATAYARNKVTQASVALLKKVGYKSGETSEMVIQTLMGAVVIPALINRFSSSDSTAAR